MDRSIVLLSGGLDSAVCLLWAKEKRWEIYAITFRYSQSQTKEIRSAEIIAGRVGVKEHSIVDVPFLNEIEQIQTTGPKQTWPAAYIPMRNTIFYAIAASWAETVGAKYLIGGHNKTDAEVYPDATKGFIKAMNNVLCFSAFSIEIAPIRILLPLANLDKVSTIILGSKLGVPFESTWSCYEGKEMACGKCQACVLRLQSFKRAILKDPIRYDRS